MVKEYYQLMGWDEKTAKPLKSTLRRLDLDYVLRGGDEVLLAVAYSGG